VVNDSVGDRFAVKATENVFVRGLIQAATIEAGGNLSCGTGMAGRGRGWIQVSGSTEMVYLDEVNGVVKGDLHAGKELINCRIVVGGDLVCRGAIIGGELGVCGQVQVGHIGTACGTPTTLMLGLPALKTVRAQSLAKEIRVLEARVKEQTRNHQTLARGRAKGSRQQQRLEKLSTEIADIQEQLEAYRAMTAQIEDSRHGDAADADTATLEVQEAIFPRVRLIVGDDQFVFDSVLTGPVTIGISAGGRPSFHQGDGHERPLAEVAEILSRAA